MHGKAGNSQESSVPGLGRPPTLSRVLILKTPVQFTPAAREVHIDDISSLPNDSQTGSALLNIL